MAVGGWVAQPTIPKHLMLVNLDGENLRGQLFIISLLRGSAMKLDEPTFSLWHHRAGCNQGSTCGRITMWASKWFEINKVGCATLFELLPTGYEDLD